MSNKTKHLLIVAFVAFAPALIKGSNSPIPEKSTKEKITLRSNTIKDMNKTMTDWQKIINVGAELDQRLQLILKNPNSTLKDFHTAFCDYYLEVKASDYQLEPGSAFIEWSAFQGHDTVTFRRSFSASDELPYADISISLKFLPGDQLITDDGNEFCFSAEEVDQFTEKIYALPVYKKHLESSPIGICVYAASPYNDYEEYVNNQSQPVE